MAQIAACPTPFGAQLLLWRIEESEAQLRALLAPLPPQAEAELQRRGAKKRRKEYLVATLLTRRLTGKRCILSYTEAGRPYVEGETGDISISHTDNLVAVALHPTRRIGIDIEHKFTQAEKLRTHYLSPAEIASLPTPDSLTENTLCNAQQSAPTENTPATKNAPAENTLNPRAIACAVAWSAKESLYKALAHPVDDFKSQMCCCFAENAPLPAQGTFPIRQTARAPHSTHTLYYRVTPQYVLTGCVL